MTWQLYNPIQPMPKRDLYFRTFILNATGTLGFAPDHRLKPGHPERSGFWNWETLVHLSPIHSPGDHAIRHRNLWCWSIQAGSCFIQDYRIPGSTQQLKGTRTSGKIHPCQSSFI